MALCEHGSASRSTSSRDEGLHSSKKGLPRRQLLLWVQARTLPTSLRPRSTSMTCSARSFSSLSSSLSSAASLSGVFPLRRVPASGLQTRGHCATLISEAPLPEHP